MKEFLQTIMDNDVAESRKQRDERLVSKWKPCGLLEGIEDPIRRRNMARLFENQKDHFKAMLNEQTSMAGGDIQGFAAVAFPIIRRVFGDLVSTSDIVSVQTMDQPVGLVFVLDFVAGTNKNGMGVAQNASFFGGGRVGAQILSGVDLTGANEESGFYGLNQGYSSPSGSVIVSFLGPVGCPIASGTVGASNYALDALCRWDPTLSGSFITVLSASKSSFGQLNQKAYMALIDTASVSGTLIKRLTQDYAPDPTKVLFFYSSSAAADHVALTGSVNGSPSGDGTNTNGYTRLFKFPIYDNFAGTGVLSAIGGTTIWGFEFDQSAGSQEIPEVDLKVEAFNIQTMTKMLKARWTAQASQDLSAWQNLDAEVELTSFLSEQVAMEIDMEVLKDLIEGATGVTQFWSRRPGRFLNRDTGEVISAAQTGDFTGNVSEWYQTLIETINGASALIARKVLKGGANFLVCGPEVQNILETTNQWFANTTVGEESTGEVGIKKEGQLRKKWDVYVTPYFYRNLILIGRKGSSNLETGYVYAPYVPLITSPAIPDPTDIFKYAKGVMTRYGKKMIRPDMYGKVIVLNLVG